MLHDNKINNIKYSFILPIINPPESLHEALNAIANQSYKNIELIVIDDSKFSNKEIINKFRDKIPEIKYFNRDKSDGLDGAFNYGIVNSSGDVIIMFTDDNIPEPNFVIKINDHYNKGFECVIVRSYVVNKFIIFACYQSLYENKNYADKNYKPHWSEGFSAKKETLIDVGMYSNAGVLGGNDNILSAKIEKKYKVIRDFSIRMNHKAPENFNDFFNQQMQRGIAGPQHELYYLKKSKLFVSIKYFVKLLKFFLIFISQIFIIIESLILIKYSEKISFKNFLKIYFCTNLKKMINTYGEVLTILKHYSEKRS